MFCRASCKTAAWCVTLVCLLGLYPASGFLAYGFTVSCANGKSVEAYPNHRSSASLKSLMPCFAGSVSPRVRSSSLGTVMVASDDRTTLGTLDIPCMGIGSLNWPLDKEDDPQTAGALQACIDGGVNFFDTAEAYGFGRSEKLVKNCLQKAGSPTAVVATKFAPVPWRQSSEDVVLACRASAERLGVDSIDLYQIHWPDIIQPLKVFGLEKRKDEIYWDGIAQCYEQGLIKNVGVSNYGPKTLARAYDALQARGVPLASNQINFSLMSRQEDTIQACKDRGVSVLGYFPLANGLLAGRYTPENMPKGLKARFMKKYVVGGVTEKGVTYPEGGAQPLIKVMREVAEDKGKTVPQIAINYAISKGVIPIPGCRDARMAEDNIGATGWRLEPGEIAALETAAKGLGFGFSSGGFDNVE